MRRGVQTGRATLLLREKRSLREKERERKRDSHSFACRAFKLSDAIKSTSFLSPTHFVLIPTCTYLLYRYLLTWSYMYYSRTATSSPDNWSHKVSLLLRYLLRYFGRLQFYRFEIIPPPTTPLPPLSMAKTRSPNTPGTCNQRYAQSYWDCFRTMRYGSLKRGRSIISVPSPWPCFHRICR